MVKKSTMKKQENVLRAASGAVFQHISSRTGRMAGLLSLVTVFVLLGMGSAWAQDPCTKTYSVCSGESVTLSHDPACGNGGHYTWAAFEDDCNYCDAGNGTVGAIPPSAYYTPYNCKIGIGWGAGEHPDWGVGSDNYCHYPGTMTVDMKQGNDPQIVFNFPNGADPNIYKYFINSIYPGANSNQSFTVSLPETASWGSNDKCSSTNFHTVVIDASTHVNWTAGGAITGFRLDPFAYPATNASSVHMSIDYIALVASVPGFPSGQASWVSQDNNIPSFSNNNTFTLNNVTAPITLNSYQVNNNGSYSFSGNPQGVVRAGWTSTESRHDVQVYPALNAGAIRSGSKQICYGDVAALPTIGNETQASQSASGATFTYQWYVSKDGAAATVASGTPSGSPSGINFKPADTYASTPGAYVFTRQVTSSLCSASPKTSEGAYTLTVLPLFVVYFALSKYIIAGVALGGVKG